MQIHIISIGKLSNEFNVIAANYMKMIKWPLKITEITYSKKIPENEIKKFEAKLIENHLNEAYYKIILDILGKSFSSEAFSKIFSRQMMSGRDIVFIIGGAFGLDQSIINMGDLKFSLSSLTMPHQLAKIILLEQIYRAQSIIQGHPYHK